MGLIEINRNPSPGQLRLFAGVGVPGLCLAAGALLWWKARLPAAAWAVWAAGAVVALAGLARPALVRPVFIGLSYAAAPAGWVMGVVLLALVFYGIMTPIGLVMRLMARDPLARKFDRSAGSYWVARRPTDDVERYFRQY